MSRCEKLLERAKRNPAGLRFTELCYLAECFGFARRRQAGSHVVFSHADLQRVLSFQNRGSAAKPYQVRQLLMALREMELVDD